MHVRINAESLIPMLDGGSATLIDVRRQRDFLSSNAIVSGALRRDPDAIDQWIDDIPPGRFTAVYCMHGKAVSQDAAQTLRSKGRNVAFVDGGMDALGAAGLPMLVKPVGTATRWITRARPKVDRVACPWLIARFIDRAAEFVYVPPAEVLARATELHAVPFDIPDVLFSHRGDTCSFDTFVDTYRLFHDSAIRHLARIIRGADTARPDVAPEAAGLAALSLGLSRLIEDDHALLHQGKIMYDALYLWCLKGQQEVHAWNP